MIFQPRFGILPWNGESAASRSPQVSAAFKKRGILAVNRAFSAQISSPAAPGSPLFPPFGPCPHLLGHQPGAGTAAPGASGDRFMRRGRSGQAQRDGRGTMVRYGTLRLWGGSGGDGRFHAGSRQLRAPDPVQFPTLAGAFKAPVARGIPAVRYAAAFTASPFAAGLRAVPAAAVAGPAPNHLAPALAAAQKSRPSSHIRSLRRAGTPGQPSAWKQAGFRSLRRRVPRHSAAPHHPLRTMATASRMAGSRAPATVYPDPPRKAGKRPARRAAPLLAAEPPRTREAELALKH